MAAASSKLLPTSRAFLLLIYSQFRLASPAGPKYSSSSSLSPSRLHNGDICVSTLAGLVNSLECRMSPVWGPILNLSLPATAAAAQQHPSKILINLCSLLPLGQLGRLTWDKNHLTRAGSDVENVGDILCQPMGLTPLHSIHRNLRDSKLVI